MGCIYCLMAQRWKNNLTAFAMSLRIVGSKDPEYIKRLIQK
jgi:hypothetical protein